MMFHTHTNTLISSWNHKNINCLIMKQGTHTPWRTRDKIGVNNKKKIDGWREWRNRNQSAVGWFKARFICHVNLVVQMFDALAIRGMWKHVFVEDKTSVTTQSDNKQRRVHSGDLIQNRSINDAKVVETLNQKSVIYDDAHCSRPAKHPKWECLMRKIKTLSKFVIPTNQLEYTKRHWFGKYGTE